MKIILNKKKLVTALKNEKDLGFVPTMGSLHKGHISLINKSSNICKKTIVSIFINKTQFNQKSDYKKYPRNLKKDISILRKCNIDYLYLPTNKQIYPDGPNKKIKISTFSKQLCGKFRPNHFKGVVDVVDRFVKLINPNKIFFGEKDMQQLKIIQEFFRRKKSKTKVVSCPTVREKNGIAFSSRNNLLKIDEKKTASVIYKLLSNNKKQMLKNKYLIKKIKHKIKKKGIIKIDYIKILDINKLIKPYKKKAKFRIFIAYHIGRVRLIDNV